jgi:hypothetical protein
MFATGSLEGASYIVGVFVLLAWYRYFNSSKNLAKVYPEAKGTNTEKLLFVSSLVLWLALTGLLFTRQRQLSQKSLCPTSNAFIHTKEKNVVKCSTIGALRPQMTALLLA